MQGRRKVLKSGGPVSMWWALNAPPPLVDIGLGDLPKTWGCDETLGTPGSDRAACKAAVALGSCRFSAKN